MRRSAQGKVSGREISVGAARPHGRPALKKFVVLSSISVGAAALVAKRHNKAVQIQKIVQYLQANLGTRMTAFVSGSDDLKVVNRWIQGEAKPDRLSRKRLQSAYEATRCLVDSYDGQTAQTWFLGTNPTFADQAPARVLRTSENPQVWSDVVLAAREFAET